MGSISRLRWNHSVATLLALDVVSETSAVFFH